MRRDEEARLRRSIGSGAGGLREVDRLLDLLGRRGPPRVAAGEVLAAIPGRDGGSLGVVQWGDLDGVYIAETLEEFGEENLDAHERIRVLGDERERRAAVAAGGPIYDVLALRRRLAPRLMLDQIQEESEYRDLYFVPHPWPWGHRRTWAWPPERRVVWLPKGWPIQSSPNDAAEGADPREALCWIADADSESGVSTEWHWLSALAGMELVTEEEARRLDPRLFKGLLRVDHEGPNVVRIPGRLFGTQWEVVGRFPDFESALEFAKENYDADDEGFIEPITETESVGSPWEGDGDGYEYVLDLPATDPSQPWLHVDTFDSRPEAERFVHQHVVGGTEDGRVKIVATERRHEAETNPWRG